jgi:transcriptional regulator with XRE-family HTH domain
MLYRLQFLIMRACERKGYSIRRLARESGISHSHLSRVLNGITEPSREMIIAVCVPLDCSLEERTEIIHCMGYMTPEESEAYRERGEHPVVVWSKIA